MSMKNKTIEDLFEEALLPEDQHPYKIPENWSWSKLGVLVEKVQYGYTEKATSEPVGPHFLRITDLDDKINWEEVPYCKISNHELEKYKLNHNDIVVARMGSVGKTQIIKNPELSVFASYLIRFINNKAINPDYLALFMKSPLYWFQISTNSKGTTRANINSEGLKKLLVPYAPINEQKRIADKVERLLSKIEEAKRLIEEAKETFEFRRVAILDKAFRGDLTKKWREENSSYLQKSLSSKSIENIKVENDFYDGFDLPSIWEWAKAESLFAVPPRNGYSPQSTENVTNTRTIKLGAITKGYFKENEYKYIDETIQKDSYLWLKNGDFLIQRANSLEYVGTAAVYTGRDDEFIYPDLIMKGRLNEDVVLPEYMVLWVNSHFGKKYIKQNATGTAGNMPKINQKVVKNFLVPIPPIQEQKEILRIYRQTNKKDIQFSISYAYDSLDKVKQSILSKAFRGELGTNKPSEENAIELLKEVLQEQVK